MHDRWLSNTYLVADELGSHAVMIDAGGPVEPLLRLLERMRFQLTHVLLTHHHHDHVAEVETVRERWPQAEVLIHPAEREAVAAATGTMLPGQSIHSGALEIEPIHTPGHTAGMLSLLVSGTELFTGDTLFRRSVGGVRAPGHTTYADLRSSIMDRLLRLPAATRIHPGHSEPTTVAEELEHNPFVRIWRGLDAEGDEPCTALGRPARLILLAPDYDGGQKAWVRYEDGSEEIVGGSQVERGGAGAQGDLAGGAASRGAGTEPRGGPASRGAGIEPRGGPAAPAGSGGGPGGQPTPGERPADG